MPRPFQQLMIAQFADFLNEFSFTRRIDAIHLHQTWRPNRSMYNGLASIEAIYQFHTVRNGWSDIAQHLTIAPDGSLWTGRNWNDPPASGVGYNGNRDCGPFMIQIIGDFDAGKDPFDGAQRDAALSVIALVQEQFGLPLESLRFHNQMNNANTCPGDGIGYAEVLDAVRDRRKTLAAEARSGSPDAAAVKSALRAFTATGVRDDELLAETADDQMGRAEELYYSGGGTDALDSARSLAPRAFSPQELAALRPHVVSMRQGRWDTGGIFNSTSGDVDALFFEHAKAAIDRLENGKKLKFVIYAHGGLVSERNGLAQAQFHIDWWKQSASEGIYPIYFVWKTGLGETIAQLLGFGARAVRDFAAAPRAAFTDPMVASIARRLGGESVWSGMKRDAEQAVLPGAVATYVATQMKKFCDQYPDRVELHAVGHSAGSVFHSHYIPMSTVAGNAWFKTTSFMAPAVRVDTFVDLLTVPDGGRRALKPETGALALFTMKKDFEKRDDCIRIYNQSLLYLVSHAFEDVDPTPILGLEESIRADPALTALFGLGGKPSTNASVVWSPSVADSGCSATRAVHHGDFSSDAPTLNSILRRILAVSDTAPIHSFPSGARALTDIWDIWAPPDDLPGFTAAPPSQPETPSAPAPSVVVPTTPGDGNRRALCVGIDAYGGGNRLSGCVHDARSWNDVLARNGFSSKLLLDDTATYDGITTALRDLITSSKSGDVIVFQYSGHGTTVPDEQGRTVDGIEEALVPIDFSVESPHLLMDFDVGAIFSALPSGVNLTCFIDCCHSGTITRMLVGAPPQRVARAVDERPRFIRLSPAEIAAVARFRAAAAPAARGNTVGGIERMRDIVFAACRPDEVAWEANGQGEFTARATPILAQEFRGTNEDFVNAVIQSFGATPRQHPMLDCAPTRRSTSFLQA